MMIMVDVSRKFAAAEKKLAEGNVFDEDTSIRRLRTSIMYKLIVIEIAH
jgi:hypothetical protein